MIARRNEQHRKEMAEFEAIKKIAEEEGAKRTVEALQKLIDKKNEEFIKSVEQMEKFRKNRQDQIRTRSGESKEANLRGRIPQRGKLENEKDKDSNKDQGDNDN
jgi:hypothetical protein